MREFQKKLQIDPKAEKTLYLTSPYPAPPFLDKVWDLLILYTEHYERFCSHIFSSLVPDLSLPKGSDPYT